MKISICAKYCLFLICLIHLCDFINALSKLTIKEKIKLLKIISIFEQPKPKYKQIICFMI
jgi:hypothetical protein